MIVFSGDKARSLGEGCIIGGLKHGYVPKIHLDSGRTVFGCECWWIEKKIAEAA